jgi:cytidylate kinase
MKKLLITIDGPAGAGKTTISRELAARLGYTFIDTGALYRAVAYEARARGIRPDDLESLGKLCRGLELSFIPSEKGIRLICNRVDITDSIRTPEITMLASAVSARPVVRKYLLGLQRDMGKEKGVVFEGRDMGTVVFPEADIKFFLDASKKTRAWRRYQELKTISSVTLEAVESDLNRRDKDDSTRDLAPLKPAADAVRIDSTDMSIQAVVELMVACVRGKMP